MIEHPIQVISLKASVDRRSVFESLNGHVQYVFVDAVVGADLTAQEITDPALFEPDIDYTQGAYGAALSHLKCWERVMQTQRALTIAEDDAIFRADFHETQRRHMATLPADWDIVLWGWNFDSILSLDLMAEVSPFVVQCDQNQLRASVAEFVKTTSPTQLLKLHQCFGIMAYTISPKGAEKFKAACFPQKNNAIYCPSLQRSMGNNGIDIPMLGAYVTHQSYVCFPPLVATKNDHSVSTIQNQTYFGVNNSKVAPVDHYHFTNDWFVSTAKACWDQIFVQFKPQKILEIGSYEGASTCYLIELLASQQSTEIHCVDTWQGGIEHQQGGIDMSAVESAFKNNVQFAMSKCDRAVNLNVHKGPSDQKLAQLLANRHRNYFDFIYIDGSHQASDVLYDAVLAFKLLKVGGILAFDDYLWSENLPQGKDILRCPKPAIDAFVNLNFRKLTIIRAPLYQLYIQKIAD